MAKLKIKFVKKNKIKNNEDYPMDIQEESKNKKIIKCIDDNYIPGFYERTIICLVFYLDLERINIFDYVCYIYLIINFMSVTRLKFKIPGLLVLNFF